MSRLEIDENDKQDIMNQFSEFVSEILAESSSGTNFQKKVEENTANSRIEREPDGISLTDESDESSYSDKRNEYANLFIKWGSSTGECASNYFKKLEELERDYPELKNDSVVAQIIDKMPQENVGEKILEKTYSDIEQNMAQADKTYYKTTEDRKPVSQESINNSFGTDSINLNDLSRNIINETDKIIKSEPRDLHEACRKAIQREWADTDKVAYKKNTYESNGKTVEYTMAAQKVDWGRAIADKSKSTEANLEQLRTFVSRQIYDYFGGFNRIVSIVVRSQQLIINNSCYMPLIDPKYLRDASLFPLDTLDYIRSGCLASLFNWKYLKKMSRLVLLDIDDVDFYLNDVASDIGAGRRVGLSTIFNIIPSLETFILNGDIVNSNEQNTEKGRIVKEKIATHKHFINFSDGYRLNIYNGTNGVQNWAVNNLKNFANDRGNRGIFMFSAGLVGRSIVAGTAGVVNLGVHMIGAIGSVIKQAMTDVTTDDFQ